MWRRGLRTRFWWNWRLRFQANPRSPAAVARYEVTFTNGVEDLEPQHQDAIVMTLDENIRVPRLHFAAGGVCAVSDADTCEEVDTTDRGRGTAVEVALDNQDDPRKDTTLTIYPVYPGQRAPTPPRRIYPGRGHEVTVIFTKQAGLSNPTEGGTYSWKVSTTKDPKPQPAAHPEAEVRQAFGEAEVTRLPRTTPRKT